MQRNIIYTTLGRVMSVKAIMREMKKLKISLEGDKWVVQNKIKCVRELAGKIGFDIPKYINE